MVLIGVSGAGKTTIGSLLARVLQWPFFDADDFHPPANRRKMSQGVPLSDEDRLPWLQTLRDRIRKELEDGTCAVFACSALRQTYRDILAGAGRGVRFVYLRGEPDLIRKRLEDRSDHFMKADLLASQFAALEEPREALVVDIDATPDEVVQGIRKQLGI